MRLKPRKVKIHGRKYDITEKQKRGVFPHKFNPADFDNEDGVVFPNTTLHDMIYGMLGDERLTEFEKEYVNGLIDSMADIIYRLFEDYGNGIYDETFHRNESYLNEKFRELHKFFNKKRLFIDMEQLLDDLGVAYAEDIAEFEDYAEDHIVPNPHFGEDEYEPETIGNPAFSTIKGRIEQDLIDRQNAYFVAKYNKGKLNFMKEMVASYVRNYTWHFGGLYTGADKWKHREYEGLTREGKRGLIRDIKRRDKYINRAIKQAPSLEENTMLYRGGRWNDFEVGSIGKLDYITSASFNPQTAKRYQNDDTLIRILAPKGSKALSINESENGGDGSIFKSRYNNTNQNEVLLARGQKYVVLDTDTYYDRRLHITRKAVTIMLINDGDMEYDI